MRRLTTLSAGLIVAIALTKFSLAADARQIASVPWLAGNISKLAGSLNAEAVRSILRTGLGESSPSIKQGWNADDPAMEVSDYGFFDLDGDRKIELLAVLDFSGRGLTTCLATIRQVGSRLSVSVLDTMSDSKGGGQIGSLKSAIRDIDGNGRLELLVSRALSHGRDRSSPAAMFDDVYKYQDGSFAIADGAHRSFYAHVVVPKLESTIARKQAAINAGGVSPADRTREQEELDAQAMSLRATQTFLRTGAIPH